MTDQSAQRGIAVQENVELLRRYAYLERSCIRALAGWFIVTPPYEVKIGMGYQLWAHAERVDALRRRLRELRGGHREANIEPALERVGEQLLHAPDAASFLTGWRWLIEQLHQAYQNHAARADPSANAMELRILGPMIDDVRRGMYWGDQITLRSPHAEKWVAYLKGQLSAAGGVDGVGPRRDTSAQHSFTSRFDRPTALIFDDRIREGELESYDNRLDLPFEQLRVAEFKVYFNEIYSAALLASVIFDAWSAGLPWEFFHDLSHHFWDEVRHCEFGMLRLRELGVEPATINQQLFRQSQAMPFLHRLCYLTLGLEVYFMPRKRPRVRRYEQAGDFRSQLFADVDWSDEGNHVHYGKKWVEYLLQDDARTVEDLQEEIAKMLGSATGVSSPF